METIFIDATIIALAGYCVWQMFGKLHIKAITQKPFNFGVRETISVRDYLAVEARGLLKKAYSLDKYLFEKGFEKDADNVLKHKVHLLISLCTNGEQTSSYIFIVNNYFVLNKLQEEFSESLNDFFLHKNKIDVFTKEKRKVFDIVSPLEYLEMDTSIKNAAFAIEIK